MTPCFIGFIGLEGIVLLCKKIDIGESSFVIRKNDVITLLSFTLDWRRSPEVTMHLSSKNISTLTLSCLWTDFLIDLHINTGFTEERVAR